MNCCDVYASARFARVQFQLERLRRLLAEARAAEESGSTIKRIERLIRRRWRAIESDRRN